MRIEGLLPRLIGDEGARAVVDEWRQGLKKKEKRRLSMEGVVLQVEDGRVVRHFCLKDVDKDQLAGMRGTGWLVYEGVKSKTGKTLSQVWDTKASEPEDTDAQSRRGYRKKYRHANHRQEVKATNKRIRDAINNRV